MRILEFRHIGPFDGCHWRREYIAFDSGIDSGETYPVVFTGGHLSPNEVLYTANGTLLNGTLGYHQSLFKEFAWYDWGFEIFQEIPHGYVPAFWEFAQRYGLEFTWECDVCGEKQTDKPIFIARWRGNRGVGIEVEGWLCEDCAYNRSAAEEGGQE